MFTGLRKRKQSFSDLFLTILYPVAGQFACQLYWLWPLHQVINMLVFLSIFSWLLLSIKSGRWLTCTKWCAQAISCTRISERYDSFPIHQTGIKSAGWSRVLRATFMVMIPPLPLRGKVRWKGKGGLSILFQVVQCPSPQGLMIFGLYGKKRYTERVDKPALVSSIKCICT